MEFDVILTNPPFGARIGIRAKELLKHYDLARQWKTTTIVSGVQDPPTLFLELCIRRLKSGGRLGIVLPEGVFGNRSLGYVWDWLRSQGRIVALLDCPRTTFQPGTGTKTNVLFFEKYRGDATASADQRSQQLTTRIAIALSCGHDRRGRM